MDIIYFIIILKKAGSILFTLPFFSWALGRF